MPRRMSFALTIPQFLDGSKTVTRRMGWMGLKVGDELIAVEKCMGLKRGERQTVCLFTTPRAAAQESGLRHAGRKAPMEIKSGATGMGCFARVPKRSTAGSRRAAAGMIRMDEPKEMECMTCHKTWVASETRDEWCDTCFNPHHKSGRVRGCQTNIECTVIEDFGAVLDGAMNAEWRRQEAKQKRRRTTSSGGDES